MIGAVGSWNAGLRAQDDRLLRRDNHAAPPRHDGHLRVAIEVRESSRDNVDACRPWARLSSRLTSPAVRRPSPVHLATRSPLSPRFLDQAQNLEQHRCAVERGDRAGIERWRDLDQVAADEVDPAQGAQQSQCFARRDAAGFGGAGAGRFGRVQAVDVELR